VSVEYLQGQFLNEVEKCLGTGENPTYWAMSGVFFFGKRGKGYGLTCPRDGNPNCSFIDALRQEELNQSHKATRPIAENARSSMGSLPATGNEEQFRNTGPATLILSCSWQNTVRTVVKSLSKWCEKNNLDTSKVFVWQDVFCRNQYRDEARRAKGEPEDIECSWNALKKRIEVVPKVLVLLAPWNNPIYIQQVWRLF